MFTATDASELAVADLQLNGDRITERALSGSSFTGSFLVPYFEEGVEGTYHVSVFDIHGNKQGVETLITPAVGSNRAPRANFNVSRSIGFPSEIVLLDASASSDPDPPSALDYEWDIDGDGIFDTMPTNESTYTLTLDTSRLRSVAVRAGSSG